MAAPKHNKSHPDSPAFDRTREKIQTTQLVKRLQNYALSQPDDQGNEVELDSGKIRSIEILLNRTLPTLSATTIDANITAGIDEETQEWLGKR
jgi:hypothetical protein